MKKLAIVLGILLGALIFSPQVFAQGVTRICTQTIGANGSNNCTDVSATNAFPVQGISGGIPAPVTIMQGGAVLSSGNPIFTQLTAGSALIGSVTSLSSGSITNPTSTLALPSTTTQYATNTLVCTAAAVATCNTALQSEFFTIPNSAGGAIVPRLRLSTNDNTATAWNGQTLQVDLWSTYPTFQTTGDRGVFITDFLTGAAAHLGAYTCIMAGTANTAYGDGTYGECIPNAGTASFLKLASGTSIFWTLTAVTGTYGATGASGVFTLTVEELN